MFEHTFLTFESVEIISKSEIYGIISFKINHEPYLIHAYLQDNKWEPRQIFHKQTDFKDCPICHGKKVAPICSSSIERQKEILDALLKRSEIRLRWITKDV